MHWEFGWVRRVKGKIMSWEHRVFLEGQWETQVLGLEIWEEKARKKMKKGLNLHFLNLHFPVVSKISSITFSYFSWNAIVFDNSNPLVQLINWCNLLSLKTNSDSLSRNHLYQGKGHPFFNFGKDLGNAEVKSLCPMEYVQASS